MSRTEFVGKTEIMSFFKDNMTIMVGGLHTQGTPETLVDYVIESGAKNLTVICGDAGFPDKGVGKLVSSGQIKTLITSYVGLNQDVADLVNAGRLDLILSPQGTMAEQIYAAGSGLGAVVTPTGVGTFLEEGKEKLTVEGREYLLELPLMADIAICHGYLGDKKGNIKYRGSARNFNPLMAMAADISVFTVDEIVEAGEIGPDNVDTPHILVDYIIEKNYK